MKSISQEAVPRALELAERYRLLNEPEQAASICHDVLATDPNNAEALRNLILATTEQFGTLHGARLEDADAIVKRMGTEYEQAYFTAIAYERWGRSQLQNKAHLTLVGDWIKRAMAQYEVAEKCRPAGNEDALLRWNACARLLAKIPGLDEEREHQPLWGD